MKKFGMFFVFLLFSSASFAQNGASTEDWSFLSLAHESEDTIFFEVETEKEILFQLVLVPETKPIISNSAIECIKLVAICREEIRQEAQVVFE